LKSGEEGKISTEVFTTTLKNPSSLFVSSFERIFYRWGKFVAVNPYQIIVSCIVVTAFCSLGFYKFRAETKANLLWIPPDSTYNTNQEWIDNNFKKNTREEFLLFKADNILTPKSLQHMLRVHRAVSGIEKDGKSFEDMCAKVPIASDVIDDQLRRRRRQALIELESGNEDYYNNFYDEYLEEDEDDDAFAVRIDFKKYSKHVDTSKVDKLLEDISDTKYCGLVTSLDEKCILASLLEIWRYNDHLISTATTEEIISAVNLLARSPWYGYDMDYSRLLGGIVRNSTGHIIGARTAQMIWIVEVPDEGRVMSAHSGVELEFADPTTLAWESEMIESVLGLSTEEVEVFLFSARSLGDVSTQSIFFDAALLAGGYIIMFVYTVLMLGRLNTLEVRLILSVVGIVSILMGFLLGIGISSLLDYPVTPIHSLLPFLCLGIGIDDMFVMAQCWANMKKKKLDEGLTHAEKLGTTLEHAGVAITVTTVTDVFAFGVGAVTQMPGLAAFCVCTAISLASIFILQISWFAAWMSLDEERIAAGRDGLVPCVVHDKDYRPSSCSQKEYGAMVMEKYCKCFSFILFKVVVIVVSLGFLVCGIWGTLHMEQKFDPINLLPSDSYARQWKTQYDTFYYGSGLTQFSGEIYSAGFDHTDLGRFDQLSLGLQEVLEEGSVLGSYKSWWVKLKEYAISKKNYSTWEEFANEDDFRLLLDDFLFSPYGFDYRAFFKFKGSLECGKPVPRIMASKFKIEYHNFPGPEEHIAARKVIEDLISRSKIPGGFSHVQVYTAWETDEIIGYELLRNIALALVCVFLITWLLLGNLSICLMVLTMVAMSLVNIVGFLHAWEISIDIVSCITVVLSIGLCVDYSAHIGHAYLVSKGSRSLKVTSAMMDIAPAVFNGGFTTFLALVLLGGSTGHAFVTFFKVFLLTVFFGLFHGLVLFPVLLSLVGPHDELPQSAIVGDKKEGLEHSAKHEGLDNPTFSDVCLEDPNTSMII